MLRRLARRRARMSIWNSKKRGKTGLGEHVERERIDAFLVDHDEAAVAVRRAERVLEVDDLADLVVGELALGGHELVALLRGAVHERRVRLALLVLQRHVQDQNVAVPQRLRHVRVPGAVVQHQAFHQAAVQRVLRDHLHLLDHQDVQRLAGAFHREDRVGDHFGEVVRELGVNAEMKGGVPFLRAWCAGRCGPRCRGARDRSRCLRWAPGIERETITKYSEGVEESQTFRLCNFKSVGQQTRMHALK